MKLRLIRCLVWGLLPLLALSACSVNRRPDWVNTHPQTSDYYYSIVKIDKHLADYKELARERALRDIAMQIVVQVQGQIESSETEIGGVASSVFLSRIQSSTTASLNDVELYSSYQDAQDYHAWYRLNKAQYRALRERRKSLALQQAVDLLFRYDNSGGDLTGGIGYLLQGLEVLDEFIDLSLVAPYQSKNIQVYQELLSRLQSLPALLELKIEPGELETVAWQKTNTILAVTLSKNGQAVQGFPLSASASATGTRIFAASLTDPNGMFEIRLEEVSNFITLQDIHVNVDKNMFSRQIKSPALALIWDRLSFNPAVLKIKVRKPRISLEYRVDGKADAESYNQVSGRLVDFDLALAETQEQADYSLRVDVYIRDGAYIPEIGVQSALGSPSLSLMNNATGEILYSETIPNLKGTGKTLELARLRARQNVAEYLCEELIYNAIASKIYP
ncbi:MAG TPA: LPP20 family lipoprotein [Candidatus Cloacimonadota bacterium]|nr:LPP20 family lipoprotein [Candidatus Cloacimonadota bacterium]